MLAYKLGRELESTCVRDSWITQQHIGKASNSSFLQRGSMTLINTSQLLLRPTLEEGYPKDTQPHLTQLHQPKSNTKRWSQRKETLPLPSKEIVTIWRPLPKPFWVKSGQFRTTQLQVLCWPYSTSTLHLPEKKCNNKQASVSRICSYLLSLFLYTASIDYICQVFATGEALADAGSSAMSLLLSSLLCRDLSFPVPLAR